MLYIVNVLYYALKELGELKDDWNDISEYEYEVYRKSEKKRC
jgi:hypothetical protein